MSRLVEVVIYIDLYIFSVPIEAESGTFFPVWNNGGYLWLLHSMSIFLFVRDVAGLLLWMWVDVSCCRTVSVPTVLFGHESMHSLAHNRVRSAVLSQSHAGIKEPSYWKEGWALCVTTFCVHSSKALLKETRSHLPADKRARPSSSLPSLRPSLPREAKISPSGLLLICPLRPCCRAELSGMACVGLFKECQPQWQISSPVLSLSILSAS